MDTTPTNREEFANLIGWITCRYDLGILDRDLSISILIKSGKIRGFTQEETLEYIDKLCELGSKNADSTLKVWDEEKITYNE